MHPVLILTHNNLELTKRAVESVHKQNLQGVSCHIIDNGSKDGTAEWADDMGILLDASPFNNGVSSGWNHGLRRLFDERYDHEHVLVIGNDTVLPEWFYAALLSYDADLVTGIAVDDIRTIENQAPRMPLTPNPDFSAFLMTRSFWAKFKGPFNERMVHYCSDCDLHIRAHRKGIGMWKANVPYYHQRSSTLNNADPQDRRVIQAQADADRGTFRSIYGCIPGENTYSLLFK